MARHFFEFRHLCQGVVVATCGDSDRADSQKCKYMPGLWVKHVCKAQYWPTFRKIQLNKFVEKLALKAWCVVTTCVSLVTN